MRPARVLVFPPAALVAFGCTSSPDTPSHGTPDASMGTIDDSGSPGDASRTSPPPQVVVKATTVSGTTSPAAHAL